MKNIKDFICTCQLRRKQKEEDKLLKLFLYYETRFNPISILDKPLLFLGYYSAATVDAVAEKLSYNCIVFHDADKKATFVTFHEK